MNNVTDLSISEWAMLTAMTYHAGSVNKHDGELYLLHVARVAFNARRQAAAYSVDVENAVAAAWLHDVIEDTHLTWHSLHSQLMSLFGDSGASVAHAVHLLSKNMYPTGTTNETYYQTIAKNPLAVCVKVSDMIDNFSRNHKITDPEKAARMAQKYSLGMSILGRRL